MFEQFHPSLCSGRFFNRTSRNLKQKKSELVLGIDFSINLSASFIEASDLKLNTSVRKSLHVRMILPLSPAANEGLVKR
jgi:hypothetical protein